MVDQVVAVVGGNIITKSDIENQYFEYQRQGVGGTGDLKCGILEDMLYQNLLINQAELDSIEITLKEVEDIIDRKLSMYIEQIGGVDKLEEYLGKSIQVMKEDLKEPTKKNLLAERMQGKLTGDIKVTPSEVRAFFKQIPADSLPLINAEIEYEQVVIYPKINEEEKLKVIEKLRGFRQRILDGDKFSTLAVLYSEDPGSATKGGELGFMSRTELVPEFAAVAFNLKPGEVSRVVETEYGYHIIQFIERKGELVNVRHILLTPKVSEDELIIAKAKLDSIALAIKKDSLTFAEAALNYSEDENSKNNGGLAINPYTGASRFEVDQIDASTYYTLKKLDIGDVSKVFETIDPMKGKKVYKIVKLRTRTVAHRANMKDDYQRIQELALESKKQKVINEWIAKKQKTTYIRIDPSYKNCNFDLPGWVK